MLEQAGQGRETPAHGGSGRAFVLALHPFPSDDGAMIDLAQHVGAGNSERAHEVPHVEPICAAGLLALLLRQPDFFFGDGGEQVEPAELAGTCCRNGKGCRH